MGCGASAMPPPLIAVRMHHATADMLQHEARMERVEAGRLCREPGYLATSIQRAVMSVRSKARLALANAKFDPSLEVPPRDVNLDSDVCGWLAASAQLTPDNEGLARGGFVPSRDPAGEHAMARALFDIEDRQRERSQGAFPLSMSILHRHNIHSMECRDSPKYKGLVPARPPPTARVIDDLGSQISAADAAEILQPSVTSPALSSRVPSPPTREICGASTGYQRRSDVSKGLSLSTLSPLRGAASYQGSVRSDTTVGSPIGYNHASFRTGPHSPRTAFAETRQMSLGESSAGLSSVASTAHLSPPTSSRNISRRPCRALRLTSCEA